jgi:hypothetical protein
MANIINSANVDLSKELDKELAKTFLKKVATKL